MSKKFLFILLFLSSIVELSYGATDHYENSAKLNTVVACVAVILIGIAIFLFYLERRISKMEKSLGD